MSVRSCFGVFRSI